MAWQIKVSDDALDLLPGEAVRGDLKILMQLGLVDRVFLTLSVDPAAFPSEPEARAALLRSTDKAGQALQDDALFSEVIYRFPTGFEGALFQQIQSHLPALLDRHDLDQLGKSFTDQGLDAILHKDFVLLNSPAGIGLKKQIQRDPLGLTPKVLQKLSHLKNEFAVNVADGYFVSQDALSTLVMAQSVQRLTNSKCAREVQADLVNLLGTALEPGVSWRVIGSLPHTLANANSVQHDLRVLLPIATILLLLLLLGALRDPRALLVLGIPFMAAPLAIAIMGSIYGKVSALALGFGIVLLGIAVDFAVHLYLALSREEGTPGEILRRLIRPVAMAATTTGSVFVVLLFSEVVSHRQMATLALSGILLAVVFSWLLIPTVVKKKKTTTEPTVNLFFLGAEVSLRRKLLIFVSWFSLLVLAIIAWPQLRYNGDLRVLDAPNQQVIDDEQYFRATWHQGGEQAFVVAGGDTLIEALDNNSRLFAEMRQAGIKDFQSLAPLLPGPAAQQQNIDAWNSFWAERMDSFPQVFRAASVRAGFTATAFDPFLQKLAEEPQQISPDSFLEGPLGALLSTMIRFTTWQPDQGSGWPVLVVSTVPLGEGTMPLLLGIDKKLPAVTVLANQKWRSQVERLLRHDMLVLSSAAALLVILLVLIAFRGIRSSVAALAPVTSALASMVIYSWLAGAELNMMHLLMGIMVIGLSVDYGIFVVCAHREHVTATTFLAVSVCAASSLIGFGVLAFAQHPALHSLGVTILCGIGAAWPTALFVSPLIEGSQRSRA